MTTLTAQFCTAEERALSAMRNAPIHCFTRDESIALAFWVQSGVLSLIACLVTFGLIAKNVRLHTQRTPGRWRLIKSPLDVYFLSLFAAEMFLAVGAILNGKWVQDGKMQIGNWCAAQSITLSIGAINTAANTLAIAVHTFMMVWCNKGFHAINTAYIVVSLPWIYGIIFYAGIGAAHRHEPDEIFRPAPYWCWIGKDYVVHRLFGVYLWLWASLLFSMLLYVPMFFWVRGNITLTNKFWRFQIHKRRRMEDPNGLRRHALTMIAYPVVYALQILPLSVARWIGFVQENHGDRKNRVPASVLLAVQIIYCLSGVTNVALFFLTRPSLLLFSKEVDYPNRSGNMIFLSGGETDSIEANVSKLEGDAYRLDDHGDKSLQERGSVL